MPSRRALIEKYFAACTSGDAGAVAACFTPDAVVYDTHVPAIRGRDQIGRFWAKTQRAWRGAAWYVDTCIEAGEEAAIEWTMTGTDRDGRRFAFRGSEHYLFQGDLIQEIRQYWQFDRDNPGSELQGFPYAADPRFHTEEGTTPRS